MADRRRSNRFEFQQALSLTRASWFDPQERARGMPDARRTRSLACIVKSTRVSHHRHAETFRHSLHDGFNGFLRALLGDRACCHHHQRNAARIVANLTPASGRQDHTTSPYAGSIVRLARCRVHRIPHPTFVTIAKRPSCGQRNSCGETTDLARMKRKMFFRMGLD
jgi:hypothetical protein